MSSQSSTTPPPSIEYKPLTLNNTRSDSVRSNAPPLPASNNNNNNTTTPVKKKQRSLPVEFALGGAATSIAVLFTNPIEVVKTRFQVQGELLRSGSTSSKQYSNMFDALYKISKYEGIRGLQGGLIPAAAYQVMMNGTRLGMYAPLQRLYSKYLNTGLVNRPVDTFTKQQQRGESINIHDAIKPNMLINILAGTSSGVAGAFLGSPFFLMKVRLQIAQQARKNMTVNNNIHSVGTQHHYSGMLSGLSQVYRSDGIRGLFRGVQAAMIRVGMGSGVQLATYDKNKQILIQRFGLSDGIPAHFAGSLVTGMIVTCVMNPADVISTRLYNQPVVNKQGTLYSGVVDCAIKTVKSEGITAFFKVCRPYHVLLHIVLYIL